MAGEGFALEKFNQAAVGIPATERSVKGKDFKKRASSFRSAQTLLGCSLSEAWPQRPIARRECVGSPNRRGRLPPDRSSPKLLQRRCSSA
jgi:hypothetical protein